MAVRCVVILLWLCVISASVQAAPSADRSSLCDDFDPIKCIIAFNNYNPPLNPGPFPPMPWQIHNAQWEMCCRGNN